MTAASVMSSSATSAPSTTMIEVSGLTKAFAGGTLAIGGLDLTFEAGLRHAVIGPNGAGKTTLLNLVSGELPPTSGRIRYDGRDVTRTSRAKRSRLGIARTFQQPTVWGTLSVADNIALAAWPHSEVRGKWQRRRYRKLSEACESYLETVGITALADRPAGALAHGERRMLDIGMALAADPRVLLLDEPAAGLTDEGVERLLAAMLALPREVTVVVVEHDFAFVSAVADTVTVLQDGKLLATGTPAEIAADASVRAAYLGESGGGSEFGPDDDSEADGDEVDGAAESGVGVAASAGVAERAGIAKTAGVAEIAGMAERAGVADTVAVIEGADTTAITEEAV